MKRSIIYEVISVLFMILFLYAGISKLLDYETFKQQLFESPIIGSAAPIIALAIPAIEIIITFILFIPAYQLLALYASLILMIFFTIYVIILVNISTKLPCSCGGILEQLTWQEHIVFNSIFTILAGIGIIVKRSVPNKLSIKTSSSI